MGLDQYWLVKPNEEDKAEALLLGHKAQYKEIGYHRKWHGLQDFMDEFYDKGELDRDNFDGNGVDITITEDIVYRLEAWSQTLLDNYEEDNSGSYPLHLRQNIIPRIRHELKQGREVVYNGDW